MSGNMDAEENCCLISYEYSGIGGTDAIIKRFHNDCQSRGFTDLCKDFGFLDATFHPNTHILHSNNVSKRKFSASIASDSSELEQRSACLGVVFHGTHARNIKSILEDGLDVNKRMSQAYGPGEYFSMKPGTSVGYCKGGLEMLVFVVVLPPASAREKPSCPADYVVVDNNGHQLPLGVLKFTSVDEKVESRSHTRRKNFLDLCMEVRLKTKIKEEAEIKAAIIKKIIMEDMESAAKIYENKNLLLTELSRKEVSWYVHQNMNKDVIPAFFLNLPNPMSVDENERVELHKVENAVEEEQEAKDRLEVARRDYGTPFMNKKQRLDEMNQPLNTGGSRMMQHVIGGKEAASLQNNDGDTPLTEAKDVFPAYHHHQDDLDQEHQKQAETQNVNIKKGQSDVHFVLAKQFQSKHDNKFYGCPAYSLGKELLGFYVQSRIIGGSGRFQPISNYNFSFQPISNFNFSLAEKLQARAIIMEQTDKKRSSGSLLYSKEKHGSSLNELVTAALSHFQLKRLDFMSTDGRGPNI